MLERVVRAIFLVAVSALLVACGGQAEPAAEVEIGDGIVPLQELQVMSEELSLFVRQAGDPEASEILIGINGGPGQSSHYMTGLEQLAGPNLTVVTTDQRGTGRSDSPEPGNNNFELADYAADLEAIRQALGVDEVHLLGHSFGALVAMTYATTYPEHTASMILMGGAAPDWAGVQAGMNRFGRRLVELQQAGVISSTLPAGGPEQFEAILPAYLSDPASELTAWQAPAYNSRTNQLTWSNIRGYDLTQALASLEIPVLIVWGADDPFGQEMAQATRDALPMAEVEYVLLDACGHFWHECPQPFLAAVGEFLDR
jgi:proline iminopeptidase